MITKGETKGIKSHFEAHWRILHWLHRDAVIQISRKETQVTKSNVKSGAIKRGVVLKWWTYIITRLARFMALFL